jgi:hypothetical protein
MGEAGEVSEGRGIVRPRAVDGGAIGKRVDGGAIGKRVDDGAIGNRATTIDEGANRATVDEGAVVRSDRRAASATRHSEDVARREELHAFAEGSDPRGRSE